MLVCEQSFRGVKETRSRHAGRKRSVGAETPALMRCVSVFVCTSGCNADMG